MAPVLSCGPRMSFVWCNAQTTESRIPFVLDICEETFRLIDQLLSEVWDGLDGRRELPPKQEQVTYQKTTQLLKVMVSNFITFNVINLTLGMHSSCMFKFAEAPAEFCARSKVRNYLCFTKNFVLSIMH